MFLLIVFFYLKYFQHEVQFVTFLQNSNVWDAAVRMLFLVIYEKVKMESLTNKNKLDSHQSSTHAVANYSFVFFVSQRVFFYNLPPPPPSIYQSSVVVDVRTNKSYFVSMGCSHPASSCPSAYSWPVAPGGGGYHK